MGNGRNKIKWRRGLAFLLSLLLVFGFTPELPTVYAAMDGNPAGSPESTMESTVQNAVEKPVDPASESSADPSTECDFVKGEALVCYKPASPSASEASVMHEAEQTLEKDRSVDDAEALLMVDGAEMEVEAAEMILADGDTGSQDTHEAENAGGSQNTDESQNTNESQDTDESQETDESKEAGGSQDINVSENTDEQNDADGSANTPGMITLVQSDHLTTEELIEELTKRDDVLYAEPNYIFEASDVSDQDVLTDRQWENSTAYGIGNDQWNTFDGDVPSPAVDTSKQVVAILDTGIDYTHEDLKKAVWADGDRYPALTAMGGGKYGYNGVLTTVDGDPYTSSDPMDDQGHGTHVAGIVAAEWNGYGTSGVTSGARVMAVKIGDDEGTFPLDAMIRGFRYVIAAKKAGVNIVVTNNSYTGTVESYSEMLVLREAHDEGIVNVFAAANNGKDMNTANVNSSLRGSVPGSMVVGSSNRDGAKSSFSNYGSREVAVFAPGEDIWSTAPMGTGATTVNSPVLTAGGVTYAVDFSDMDTPEDAIFDLQGEGVQKTIESAADGKHVLRLTSGEEEPDSIDVTSKELPDISGCKAGFLRVYSDRILTLGLEITQMDSEGEEIIILSKSYDLEKGYSDIGFRYDGGTDVRKNVRLMFQFSVIDPEAEQLLSSVDISMLRLNTASSNYKILSGTSMAAPMVSGGVAVLAAAYPEDSPEKLVARVTGSVLPVASLKDKCISGGIFRLDRALAGNTVPVPMKAEVTGTTFTLTGFFFGGSGGTVKVGGTACSVTSWSDTKITAKLPNGYTAGEKLVEVTSGKGTGRRYLRMGSQSNLYSRLPLPGSTFSSDGEYVISEEARKKYSDFYGGDPGGMVGLNGYLYTLHGSVETGTTVYRYRISKKTWERVCSAKEYLPVGGVCTWNGKILFVASRDSEEKAAIGLLDPEKKKISWTVYQKNAYEEDVQMINNGFGIYLIGGSKGVNLGGGTTEPHLRIRQLNPSTMKVTELEGLGHSNADPVLGCDDTGLIYACECSKISDPGFIEISSLSIQGKESSFTVLAEGDSLFPKLVKDSAVSGAGVVTKKGILLTGLPEVDATGAVIADTYMVSLDGSKSKKQSKVMSFRPAFLLCSTGYQGMAYFMGATNAESDQLVFAGIEADTYETYGEKSYCSEWVNGIRYGADGFRKLTRPYRASWKTGSKGTRYKDTSGWYPRKAWQKIDGCWYYFDSDGWMECCAYRDGYYVAKSGKRAKKATGSWVTNKTGKRYKIAGKGYIKNCWVKIDGKTYYFNAKGYVETDSYRKGYRITKAGVRAAKATGKWKTTKNGKRYAVSGAYLKKRWMLIDNKWYYFNEDGYAETNAYRSGYHLSANGVCSPSKVGKWMQNSKGWWYKLAGGSYLKSRWAMINGKWYYFDSKGYMVTHAWVKGRWLSKNGAWIYQPTGSWKKDSKGWRYGDTSGWYAKNKTYRIDGKVYRFNAAGYCENR